MRHFLNTASIALLAATMLVSSAAQAAPLWLERKFIPTPELVDPIFAQNSDTKTVDVDHSAFDSLLETYLVPEPGTVSRVKYSDITAADRAALGSYIASLEAQDVTRLTLDQQKAFWINLYNAATIGLIVDQYPVKSIRNVKVDGKGPWDLPLVTVNTVDLTLSQIENHVLRALFDDPRLHYALNCASIGCPNLAARAYTAETLETMLENAAIAYVNDPRGAAIEKNRLVISKIYGWYREDFGNTADTVLAHLRRYARGDLAAALANVTKIKKHRYDWALNDAASRPEG
ncbi:MAG: DUF547 domain-containing protein [Pseudomonadota bacterium]